MRLFVATWPPADVVERLQALPRPALPSARWTGPEHWHVTLRFLGEVAEAAVHDLVAALEAEALGTAAVGAAMGPETACFGRSVLMVPVAGLEALAAATVEATAAFGAAPMEARPFVGHLTLARSPRRGTDLRRFAGQPLAAAWTASELTLVRSHTHRTGARYDIVSRFALPA